MMGVQQPHGDGREKSTRRTAIELIGMEKIKTGLVGSPPESFRFRSGPKAHLPSPDHGPDQSNDAKALTSPSGMTPVPSQLKWFFQFSATRESGCWAFDWTSYR